MNFFSRIFKSEDLFQNDPDIKFGRFSDAYKTPYQYQKWDESVALFEDEKFMESYRAFFEYLKAETGENVTYSEDDEGQLKFQILQGSKKVVGYINGELIKAEAKIATSSSLKVGFLRRMIEFNYNLKYSRYALDSNDDLTLVFDSYLIDGSPYKLYYALKEIAVNADKQDDLLVKEFDSLEAVNTGHLSALPDSEKTIKVNFLKKSIQKVFSQIENSKLKSDQFAGGIIYLLLNTTYKLDFLVKPEGQTMETLERIHRTYFAKDGKTTVEKNAVIHKELDEILKASDEAILSELYATPASFGIVNPNNHNQFVSFVDGELGNMEWHLEQKHHDIALAVPGYIVGYCLFNYGLPKPDRELLQLYYRILEPEYFEKLSFPHHFYDAEKGTFDEKMINKAISEVAEKFDEEFPLMKPNLTELHFESPAIFARSYLMMMRNLDLTKTDA